MVGGQNGFSGGGSGAGLACSLGIDGVSRALCLFFFALFRFDLFMDFLEIMDRGIQAI